MLDRHLAALALLFAVGCAAVKTQGPTPDGGAADRGSGKDLRPGQGGAGGGGGATPAGCGDSKLDVAAGEACDDGNTRGGDGCSPDCRSIGKDFSCPEPGKPCVYQVKCGDGALGGNEQCDPPNVGNGCSAACRLEAGYVCDPPPSPPTPGQPSKCRRSVCGDRTREGTEACDDGNTVDGDGCSSTCSLEPDCATGACASKCGDGIKLAPEACDDGNTKDGDGCSATCVVELGFACADSTANPPLRLNLLVTYRDFISFPVGAAVRHPDFEIFQGLDVTPLLVKTKLGADGKPVMDGRCARAGVTAQCPYDQQLTSQANFDQWYHDTPGVNVVVKGTLDLPRGAGGAYVYDSGGSGFYPVDDQGWVAPPNPRETTSLADGVINDGRLHNFGFTTEIHYFFQYRGGESLAFSGDDDVWIFINRNLALDLGGLHSRNGQDLDMDASAAALGLARGGLYEIALFHAERHSSGSNFKLTLTGFTPTSSTCGSACGDGAVAANEQCDDGNNVDGDGCSHDCRYEIVVP